MYMSEHARLVTGLETAQSNRLNHVSNLRASLAKKNFTVSFFMIVLLLEQLVSHEEFFCKTGVLLRGINLCTRIYPLFELLDQIFACLSATPRNEKTLQKFLLDKI